MAESYWFIKNCDLFSQVSHEDIAWLESKSKMRKLKRGEPIYMPSETADGILLVASGRVKICHTTPEGKQSIIAFVDAGEVFGELALLDSQQRDEYAETTEKTTLVLVPKLELQAIVRKYPRIVLGVTKLIGLRRQKVERRLRNLLFRSNRERVIHLLLELSEKYGEMREDGSIELKIRLSHQEMASVIGSTRETVTVVLGQLQSENMLSIARRRISLLDLDRLAKEVKEPIPNLEKHKAEPFQNPKMQHAHRQC
jgi:CRP-like cAMP-binding protein